MTRQEIDAVLVAIDSNIKAMHHESREVRICAKAARHPEVSRFDAENGDIWNAQQSYLKKLKSKGIIANYDGRCEYQLTTR